MTNGQIAIASHAGILSSSACMFLCAGRGEVGYVWVFWVQADLYALLAFAATALWMRGRGR